MGLPVGKHIVVYANISGEEVARPYTPTTLVIADECMMRRCLLLAGCWGQAG